AAALPPRDLWRLKKPVLQENYHAEVPRLTGEQRSRREPRTRCRCDERSNGTGASEPSLLAGLLHDADGHPMTPTHAVKGGRRYRYYVSQPLITQGRSATQTGWRIPAGDIEQLVGERLCGFLANEADVHKAIEQPVPEGTEQQRLITRARELAAGWS